VARGLAAVVVLRLQLFKLSVAQAEQVAQAVAVAVQAV
jgi:hypothetical protein